MALEFLQSLNIDLDPETPVRKLIVVNQQMVEIAKVLSFPDTRIMVMDESNAALTDSIIEDFFRFIRQLKALGAGESCPSPIAWTNSVASPTVSP